MELNAKNLASKIEDYLKSVYTDSNIIPQTISGITASEDGISQNDSYGLCISDKDEQHHIHILFLQIQ